jgi:hypothetical protein
MFLNDFVLIDGSTDRFKCLEIINKDPYPCLREKCFHRSGEPVDNANVSEIVNDMTKDIDLRELHL